MKDIRPKTIICDIDGTLVKHDSPLLSARPEYKMVLLPGTPAKLDEWDRMGYNIILLTGRRESARKVTEKQLAEAGIIYDQLIMGIGGGVRVLINDLKSGKDHNTAISFNLKRDTGIKDIEI